MVIRLNSHLNYKKIYGQVYYVLGGGGYRYRITIKHEVAVQLIEYTGVAFATRAEALKELRSALVRWRYMNES